MEDCVLVALIEFLVCVLVVSDPVSCDPLTQTLVSAACRPSSLVFVRHSSPKPTPESKHQQSYYRPRRRRRAQPPPPPPLSPPLIAPVHNAEMRFLRVTSYGGNNEKETQGTIVT